MELLQPGRGGLFVDATVGLGGHAELILAASPRTRLLAVDRDPGSLERAGERLAGFAGRFELVHGDYRELPSILESRGHSRTGSLAGLIADFGISSWQLDSEGRGFSFQRDEPLDMRMDRTTGPTAAQILASEPEEELARIFYEYGEERRSRRIARAIVDQRRQAPITTTGELAQLVERVMPRRGARLHPATRVFQALRIAVNDELSGIEQFVSDSVEALQPRGRLVLLSFHSLEDRPVKTTLRNLARRCNCPPGLPRCVCGAPDRVRILTRKPLRPSIEEVAANPRSRSAKLRAAERV